MDLGLAERCGPEEEVVRAGPLRLASLCPIGPHEDRDALAEQLRDSLFLPSRQLVHGRVVLVRHADGDESLKVFTGSHWPIVAQATKSWRLTDGNYSPNEPLERGATGLHGAR